MMMTITYSSPAQSLTSLSSSLEESVVVVVVVVEAIIIMSRCTYSDERDNLRRLMVGLVSVWIGPS